MSDRKEKIWIKQSGELPTGEYPNAEGLFDFWQNFKETVT
jgi:hypothetical protein